MSSVNDFIGPNEEVRYIGTYDVKTVTSGPNNSDYSGTFGVITEVAGICGFGLLNVSYFYATTGLLGSPPFIYENYSLATVGNANELNLILVIVFGNYHILILDLLV